MELSDFPLIKESQQIIPLQLAKQNEMIPLKIEEQGSFALLPILNSIKPVKN